MDNREFAERQLLGACMLDLNACDLVLSLCEKEFFFTLESQAIFEALRHVRSQGYISDHGKVASQAFLMLKRAGEKVAAYDIFRIVNDYVGSVATANCIEFYVRQVVNYYARRVLVQCNENLSQLTEDESLETDDLLDRIGDVMRPMDEMTAIGGQNAIQLRDAISDVLLKLDQQKETHGHVFETGLSELDRRIIGLRAGKLVVVAAASGGGKTAMALSIVIHATMGGNAKALFVSMEMKKEEITQRVLSSMALVNNQKLERKVLNANEKKNLVNASKKLSESTLWFLDESNQSTAKIVAECKKKKKQSGLDIVVIDFLQMLKFPQSRDNFSKQVSDAARDLKNLALDLNICVICLSQVNKEGTIKESGGVKEAADTVVMLEIDGEPPECRCESDYYGVKLRIDKNRGGPLGSTEVDFYPALTRFQDKDVAHFDNYSDFGEYAQ